MTCLALATATATARSSFALRILLLSNELHFRLNRTMILIIFFIGNFPAIVTSIPNTPLSVGYIFLSSDEPLYYHIFRQHFSASTSFVLLASSGFFLSLPFWVSKVSAF